MSDIGIPESDASLPIASLPKTALQAIYHAVTGKTENLSKDIVGNKIITSADIDRLRDMIVDQMGHYDIQSNPVVTIVVKCANDRSITYSSWERYVALRIGNHDVTSEISVKFEFILQLPGTPAPQRLVLNVSLDSSLPVVEARNKGDSDAIPYAFFLMIRSEWKAVTISIDFVDFLIAKIFTGVVEEWFAQLTSTPKTKLNTFMLKYSSLIRSIIGKIGRLGFAIFLASYVWFRGEKLQSMREAILAAAIGLFVWGVYVVFEDGVSGVIMKRIVNNVIPSVIILTDADQVSYDKIRKTANSPAFTLMGAMLMIMLSVGINIASSYIYSWLSAKR